MSLEANIKAALLDFIKSEGVTDAVSVYDWEDRTAYGGYCETCEYEFTVVDICYLDVNGRGHTYTYDGSFAELVSRL